MSKYEIDECCGKEPEFVDSTDIEPGLAINVYLCKKCDTVHKYQLVYPLVRYAPNDFPTIFQKIS